MNWFKQNILAVVTIIIALTALGISISNCQTNTYYTEHSIVYDRLNRLDDRILRIEDSIEDKENQVYLEEIVEAKENRNQAEIEWSKGNYNEANYLIDSENDILASIPTGGVISWFLIIITAVGALLFSALLIFLIRKGFIKPLLSRYY